MSQQPLRFGLLTPILRLNPSRFEPWQVDAGGDEIRQMAIAADEHGFHHVDCAEHVMIPTSTDEERRGERYYDPLSALSFMAGVTRRIRLMTHILVLPYHHPIAVAKRYGTLDRLSNGRLILGIGVGTLKPEFELLGAEFARRGEIYTEALQALRSALGKREPEFEGKFFRYKGIVVDPHSIQQPVPMWLGGSKPISLRRALASADGWVPTPTLDLAVVRGMLDEARKTPAWQARKSSFEVMLAPRGHDITEANGVAALVDGIAECVDAGATLLNVYFPARSITHYIEQLAIFQDRVAPRFQNMAAT